MSKERVLYFDYIPLFYGMGLEKIETMPVPELNSIDINDAIEFYQIHRYFDDKVKLEKWSDEQYQEYEDKSKELFALTFRFFDNLNDQNVVEQYKIVEQKYHTAFWELFAQTKLYVRISETVFDQFLHLEKVPFLAIIQQKSIVDTFGRSLKRFILENEWSYVFLIRAYEQNKGGKTKLFLPKELTGEEIANCLAKYVDSEQANINDLDTIYYMQKSRAFPVSDELRLKAQRKRQSEWEKIKNKRPTKYRTIHITISDQQEEEMVHAVENHNYMYSYSGKRLGETLDYPSILGNFIYLFDYVDSFGMRSNHASVRSMGLPFELAQQRTADRYPDYFKRLNLFAAMQMDFYYRYLKSKSIYLEDVLQWFFTQYLQAEFGCPEIRVTMPSAESTYYVKCMGICPAIETVVKQFTQYVKKGYIDFDLLKESFDSPVYRDIPSLIQRKYVYPAQDKVLGMAVKLFSSQSILHYVERIWKEKGKEYSCFRDLLSGEKVYKQDYPAMDHNTLKLLEDNGLIRIEEDGQILPIEDYKLTFLRDLYYKDVISRWHYWDNAQPVFQEWIDNGYLREESTLLTKPEADYFDYCLNSKTFVDGLKLRNIYMHGNAQTIEDEREHESNYNMLLRLMVLLAIKINDDFCLFEQRQKEEQ